MGKVTLKCTTLTWGDGVDEDLAAPFELDEDALTLELTCMQLFILFRVLCLRGDSFVQLLRLGVFTYSQCIMTLLSASVRFYWLRAQLWQ